ncbi:hypothetical protein ACFXC8_22595 [Streptomyces sp. NPDC059441]|jgi:purine-nucleoside phosphorylase|uniref:hypothetical protein n=1 Tax=Streptomyces sp. NPDC059441 TaxID=3346829 RepID=UPI003697F4F7
MPTTSLWRCVHSPQFEGIDAWQNAFYRLARCYERRAIVVGAFFDIADTIITVRSLIRRAWTTTHRWEEPTKRRP